MRFVSFDLFRTLGFPETPSLKPEQMFANKDLLTQADWVLFPEYWQVNVLVYGLKCRIFPSEASYRLGHDKIEMTRAFQMLVPGHTPSTHILANTPANADWLWEQMPRPFVAKLPKSSMGEGVWLIEDRTQWRQYLERAPSLYVQEHLPIDRDLRVVIVGDRVVSAYWRRQSPWSFHNNLARGGQVDISPVPAVATDLALRLARTLGIDHAGFDIAMVGGHPYVLEFNRLFGNQGLGDGGALRQAILEYLSHRNRENDPDEPLTPLAA